MKKIFKNVFFDTLLFLAIYLISYFILKHFNLIFMQWIRDLACFAISIGFILGLIQINIKLSKKNIVLCIIVWLIFTFIIIAMAGVGLFYLIFFYDPECISNFEGRKMVQETRSVWKSNYINYYDYMNPFVRSRQNRVKVQYDDAIAEDEYAGTTYYNEKGEEVEDINGTEYVDLTALKSFTIGEKNSTYENVKEVLEHTKENYCGNYCNIEYNEFTLYICFSNNPQKIVNDESKDRINKIIDTFLKNQKENSIYRIYIDTGEIRIVNIETDSIYNSDQNRTMYIDANDEEGILDYCKKEIGNFSNAEDTQGRKILISYKESLYKTSYIEIIYKPFISKEKQSEDSEAIGNVGYYEYYVDGELKGIYYVPDWKINVSENNGKLHMYFSSKDNSVEIFK